SLIEGTGRVEEAQPILAALSHAVEKGPGELPLLPERRPIVQLTKRKVRLEDSREKAVDTEGDERRRVGHLVQNMRLLQGPQEADLLPLAVSTDDRHPGIDEEIEVAMV